MFRKKKQLIGLDIGSHTVKIVQLEERKNGLELVALGVAAVAPQAIVEGVIREPDSIAGTIRQLATNLKIKEKLVATSISGYAVMIKKIEVPSTTKEELERNLYQELGQYIPYNIQEVRVDYQVLDLAREKTKNVEVLLVAAKKEAVDEYVDLVSLSGFEAAVVDVDFFALSNAYEVTYGVSNKEPTALVDVGANKISIIIIQQGIPVFTRDISMGGAQLSVEIQNKLGIPYDTAERVKLGENLEHFSAGELEEIFSHTAKTWSAEVKRALDFYFGTVREAGIEKMLLSGGSCRIPGLNKLLAKDTGLTVEIFNPLEMLDYNSEHFDPDYISYIGPQLAICLGLALRKADER
jgi:type IV pilus assembly protein PilM